MRSPLLALLLAHPLLSAASLLQQQPLLDHDSTKKPLVSSEALQADINVDKLFARAKHLFELAKLSIEDYAHPTRVIGSKGEPCLLPVAAVPTPEVGNTY